MAKFGKPDPDADPVPPPTVTVNVAPAPAATTTTTSEVVLETADMVEAPKPEEHWMKAYWRPAMGWLYMLICFVDFVAFPVISMFLPVMIKGMQYVPWKSITLDNGGLIHLAFGAILGVTAYGRTLEKKTGTN
jgi:uncharacterized membrane protein